MNKSRIPCGGFSVVLRSLVVPLALSAFFIGAAHATTVVWTGGGNSSNWMDPANWGGTAPTPSSSTLLEFSGTLNANTYDNFAAGSQFSGLLFNYFISGTVPTGGPFLLSGSSLLLSGGITNEGSSLSIINNNINFNGAAQTISSGIASYNGSTTGNLTINGVISNGGITKTEVNASSFEGGILTLTGNNTYAGVTTITNGVISVGTLGGIEGSAGGTASNLGAAGNAATNLVFNGGALQYTGVTGTSDRSFNITNGDYAVWDVSNASTNLTLTGTVGTGVASTGGILKNGLGTLTLDSALINTGTTIINTGNLVLNFAAAGAPQNNILNSGNNLAFGSAVQGTTAGFGNQTSYGTLTINGNASLSGTQNFGLLVVPATASSVQDAAVGNITINDGALGVGNTVNFTGIGNFNGGNEAAVVFNESSADTITFGSTGITNVNGLPSGNNADIGMILNNTDWVALSATTSGTVQAATYVTGSGSSGWGGGFNVNVVASGTTNQGANTLRFNTAAPITLEFGGSTKGILETANVGANPVVITNYPNNPNDNGNRWLVIDQNNTAGDMTFAADLGAYPDNLGDNTALLKLGAGRLILSGSNNYPGNTNIAQGTLQISSNINLGGVTVSGNAGEPGAGGISLNGTLEVRGGANVILDGLGYQSNGTTPLNGIYARGLAVGNGGGVIDVDAPTTLTISGGVDVNTNGFSQSGLLTKQNAGELIITGANYSQGGLLVTGGTLQAAMSASPLTIGTVSPLAESWSAGTGLNQVNFTTGNTVINAAGASTEGYGGGALGVGWGVVGTGIPAGTTIASISGTTITLSNATTGNSTGSYEIVPCAVAATFASGTNQIYVSGAQASLIQVGDIVTSATASAWPSTATSGGIQFATVVTAVSGTTITLSQSTVAASSAGNVYYFGGPGQYSAPSTTGITLGENSIGDYFNGAINGIMGNVVFDNNVNVGSFYETNLGFVSADALGEGPVTVSGGVLDLAGLTHQPTITGVTITSGTIQNGTIQGTSYTANVGSGTTATISATLAGNSAVGLTLNGPGTLYLTNSNTYFGGTTINSGYLQIGNALSLGAPTGSLAVNSGTLDLGANSVTVGALSGSAGGVITTSSAGSLVLTASSYVGGVYGGTINDGAGTLALTVSGTGPLILTGSNAYSGATIINAGSVLQLGNNTTTGALSNNSAITDNGILEFYRSNAATQGTDFSTAAITGTGSLVDAGAGVLALTASNAYSGPTTINSGATLELGNNTTTGALAVSSTISDAGTLAFNRSNTVTEGVDFGTVTGAGGLTQQGTGTLLLSASNGYTGATNVLSGVLKVTGTINSASTTTIGNASSLTTSAILEGSGSIGALVVGAAAGNTGAVLEPGAGIAESVGAGTSLYTGALTITSGSVALEIGRSDASSQTTLAGNGGDIINTSGNIAINGGNLQLSAETGYAPRTGDILYLFNNGGTTNTGSFTSINGASPLTMVSGVGTFSFDGYLWNITDLASTSGGAMTGGHSEAVQAALANGSYVYWDSASNTWGTGATAWYMNGWNGTTNAALAGPGPNDNAVLGLYAASTITLGANQNVQGLFIEGNAVTVAASGTPYTITIGSNGLTFGYSAGNSTIGSTTAANAVNLALNGNQNWTLTYNNTNTLTVDNGVTDSSTTSAVTLTFNAWPATAYNTGTLANFAGVISDGNTGNGATTSINVDTTGGGFVNFMPAASAPETYTGSTTVQGGVLQLNFANVATNIINSSSELILGGGAYFAVASGTANIPSLRLQGGASGSDAQTFNNTLLNVGASSINFALGGATAITLTTGTITRNAGAVLNIPVANTTADIVAVSNTNDATGIVGDWATIGAGTSLLYATVSGGDLIGYTGTTAASANLANVTSPTTNYSSTNPGTLAASATANTLTVSGGNMNLGNHNLSLNGLLDTENGSWTISSGTITIGSSKELVITGLGGQTVNVNVPIVDNSAGASNLTLAMLNNTNNNAPLVLNAQSTYSGTTYISNGFVEAVSADTLSGNTVVSGAFGAGGPITFAGGVLEYTALSGTATDYSSRFVSSASPIGVTLPTNNAPVIWNNTIAGSNTGGLAIYGITGNGGEGMLQINGSNNFSGPIIVNGDVNFVLGNGHALGNGNLVTVNSGLAVSANTPLVGANQITASFSVTQSDPLIFDGYNSMQVASVGPSDQTGNNRTFGSDIAGGTLTVNNWTLSQNDVGQNSEYLVGFGNTTVGAFVNNPNGTGASTSFGYYDVGTLTLTGSSTMTGGFAAYAGVTNLNFNAPGATQNNILSIYGIFQTWGGTLELTGDANYADSESMTNQLFQAENGYGQIVMNPNGQSLVLNLAGLGRVASGLLNVVLSGSSSATNGVTTTSAVNSYTGLIDGVTVNGNDWAAKGSGSTATNIVAYTGYYDQDNVGNWTVTNWPSVTTGSNVSVSGTDLFSGSLASSGSISSIRINNTAGGTLNLGGYALNVGDGILVTNNVASPVVISTGTLVPTPNTNIGMYTNVALINNAPGANTLTVGASIINNPAGSVAANLITGGTGTIILNGTDNVYGGYTAIQGGVVEAGDEVNYTTLVTSGASTTAGSTTMSIVLSSTNSTPVLPAVAATEYVFGNDITYGTDITSVTTGTVTLNGTTTATATISLSNTASGTTSNTYFGFGSVTLSSTSSLGEGNLQLNNGVLGLTGNFTRMLGAGAGTWLPEDGYFGFAAFNGTNTVTVNFGGAATPISVDWRVGSDGNRSGGWGTNSEIVLGAAGATGMVNLMNPVDTDYASRVIDTVQGANGDTGSVPFDAQISGALTDGNGGYVTGWAFLGNGAVWLSATNGYNGETEIMGSDVSLNGVGLLSNLSPLIVDGTNAAFDLSGTTTIAHNQIVYSVALLSGSLTGNGLSTLIANWGYSVMSGTATVALGDSTANGFHVGLTKTTAGTVLLSGSSTYQGATAVKAGTLIVSGSLYTSGAVMVGDSANLGTSAILAGKGIVGNLTVGAASGNTGAEVEPSNGVAESVGSGTVLTAKSFTLGANSDATVALQIGRNDGGGQTTNAGDSSDRIDILSGGAVSLGTTGNLQLSLQSGYTPQGGDILYLIVGGASETGTFATVNSSISIVSNSFSYGGQTWDISYNASAANNMFTDPGVGNDIALYAVPEPGTWATIILGFGTLLAVHRRRRASR